MIEVKIIVTAFLYKVSFYDCFFNCQTLRERSNLLLINDFYFKWAGNSHAMTVIDSLPIIKILIESLTNVSMNLFLK